MSIKVGIKLLTSKAILPQYATSGSAGCDLCASIEQDIIIAPGQISIIPTGISIELPLGYEAQIRPRSGLAAKNGLTVLNSPGTIDADYRGEIKIILINHGKTNFVITEGMRIAQMIIAKHEHALFIHQEDLSNTDRGHSGFGSTGV
jgi:dUTP pyrophosphatase